MRLLYTIINFVILAAVLFLVGRKLVAGIFRSHRDSVREGLRRSAEGFETAAALETRLAEVRAQQEAQYAEDNIGSAEHLDALFAADNAEAEALRIAADEKLENALQVQRLQMLRSASGVFSARLTESARALLSQEPFVSEFRSHEAALAEEILALADITPGDRVYLEQKKALYVTLRSAFPLDPALAERFRTHMTEKAGNISFRVLTDETLIGGMQLRVGDTVYDGTVANLLRTLPERLKDLPDDPEQQTRWLREVLGSQRVQVEELQFGRVLSVSDGICWLDGLEDVMYGELLGFENGVEGMVLSVESGRVGCVVFEDYEHLQEFSPVRRLGRMADVPAGEALLGRVVNALGAPLDGKGPVWASERRPIETPAPAILDRKSVSVPLHTGIKAVDALVPIGRGQRELIIGDRQTGKTAIAVNAILNQKGKDVICVYVAIGQKESSVASVVNTLEQKGALNYTVVVCADAFQSAPMRYIAPYAGMAMAEYFMYRGQDVLIVFDDLSKQAVAYREMSLLLHRPSGREAYPGDVFYLHSRLLERAARLSPEAGGGSITALPIVETQAGDISAYIPTNVISITDGQIFLESDLLRSGQRPAVNVGLSVSRVGGAAQIGAMRQIAGRLRMDLAQYRGLASFAQFGADIDASTRSVLDRGERMTAVLLQPLYAAIPVEEQVLAIFAVSHGFADDLPAAQVNAFTDALAARFRAAHPDALARIASGEKMSEEFMAELSELIEKFKEKVQ